MLFTELTGAILMLPFFCRRNGASGIWFAIFHSISAYCNAGFDLMGNVTGPYSSLTGFSDEIGLVIPICLMIISGGLGFLTWFDICTDKLHISRYRMQSKVILSATALLIVVPAVLFFYTDFASFPLKERICLSLFQAVTPRTAGFNTIDFGRLSDIGRGMILLLMLVGGAPGSTAGGLKVTTICVLWANLRAVLLNKKSPVLFHRRIENATVNNASTLLTMYLFVFVSSSFIICEIEHLPIGACLFESASAIATV